MFDVNTHLDCEVTELIVKPVTYMFDLDLLFYLQHLKQIDYLRMFTLDMIERFYKQRLFQNDNVISEIPNIVPQLP